MPRIITIAREYGSGGRLIAQGRTEITNVYHIDRGYDNIDHKLITLGAHITRYHIDE